MEKSSEPVAQSDPHPLRDACAGCTLDVQIAPGFLSHPPQIDPQAMLRRIAETMPWRSTRPGEMERRFEQAVREEFIL